MASCAGNSRQADTTAARGMHEGCMATIIHAAQVAYTSNHVEARRQQCTEDKQQVLPRAADRPALACASSVTLRFAQEQTAAHTLPGPERCTELKTRAQQ